jgi:hypothetical protein
LVSGAKIPGVCCGDDGQSLASYSQFLVELNLHFEVVCISAPLPTIQDGNDWGDIANARRKVTASQV